MSSGGSRKKKNRFVILSALVFALTLNTSCGNNRRNQNKPVGPGGKAVPHQSIAQGSSDFQSVQQLLSQWKFLEISPMLLMANQISFRSQIVLKPWLVTDDHGAQFYEVWPMFRLMDANQGRLLFETPMGLDTSFTQGYLFETAIIPTSAFRGALDGMTQATEVALRMVLYFAQGYQFSPTQSKIDILECAGSEEYCSGNSLSGRVQLRFQ